MTNRAFVLDPVQVAALRVALHRDRYAPARWRALVAAHGTDALTRGKVRRLLPLVHHAVVGAPAAPSGIPARTTLEAATAAAAREHTERVAWLGPLLGDLAEAGIPVLVLKGVALALGYYADPALRPMVDVDLLVPAPRLDATLAVLDGAGWSAPARLGAAAVRRGQEVDLRGPDGEKLDLHWRLSSGLVDPRGPAVEDALLARSVPLAVAGAPARALDPTDLLLHLLVHGATNGWRNHPLWVADAATVIDRTDRFDGHRLATLARDHGVAYPVAAGLAYLETAHGRVARGEDGEHRVLDALVPRARLTLRQRRLYTQIASGVSPPRWLRRTFGRAGDTYHYWATQTVTWPRRHALREFPSWLADHWGLPGPAALPGHVLRRTAARAFRRLPPGTSQPNR